MYRSYGGEGGGQNDVQELWGGGEGGVKMMYRNYGGEEGVKIMEAYSRFTHKYIPFIIYRLQLFLW